MVQTCAAVDAGAEQSRVSDCDCVYGYGNRWRGAGVGDVKMAALIGLPIWRGVPKLPSSKSTIKTSSSSYFNMTINKIKKLI